MNFGFYAIAWLMQYLLLKKVIVGPLGIVGLEIHHIVEGPRGSRTLDCLDLNYSTPTRLKKVQLNFLVSCLKNFIKLRMFP